MTLTIKNILANIAGRVWGVLSAFLFIPLYIKYLGFDSYSIISFTIMIAGIIVVLDSGLTATLSREFARKDKTDDEKIQIYQTLESLFALIIGVAILLMILFSDSIALQVDSKTFVQKEISYFFKIVSVDIGLQLLLRFYQGGLLGLEKQVKANAFMIGWGVVRNALVIVLIYLIPRLDYFFIWQAISTFLFTIFIKYTLDREVYKKRLFNIKPKFQKNVFQQVSNFVGGMFLIAIISVLNTQLDKIVINQILSVENLGYYTLAVSISFVLVLIVNPIATVVLPKFTGYYSQKKLIEAKLLFGKTSKIVSVLIFTFLWIFVFFSEEILWLWTGNEQIVKNVAVIIPVLSAAYAMVALQVIPYYVAIANSYTKLNTTLGVLNILIIIPGYYLGVSKYGMIGAAFVFFITQLCTTIIYLFVINKKYIKDKMNNIVFKQVLFPFVLSLLVVFCVRYCYVETLDKFVIFVWITFALGLALVVNVLVNFHREFNEFSCTIKKKMFKGK